MTAAKENSSAAWLAHKADAIIAAARKQLEHTDMHHYPVDVFQTSSGASSNMNVNEAHIQQALHRNPMLVTALNPVIGYMKAADIAKKSYQQQRPVLEVALEETELSREELESLLDPARLCRHQISSD